ncbi:MAG: alanine--tRNA ligase [Candidatus Dormibacter sp.]
MTSAEIRQRFLNFFKERDHKVLPSSSLIPFGDPTLLLTSAGMVQFKPYFLGQAEPPQPRAATSQKVFRTVDVELVGHDGHHLTFFEMLGNFSFGDYFKEKAIPFAWQFLTEELGLDKDRLWAGIHTDDDESFQIWTATTSMPTERIRRFGDDYNFWAAGPTGPCGPDSEVHYDWGAEYSCGRPDCGPNCEYCDRFLEIWNLVFMQWNRDQAGKRTDLRRKGIDTGMGLERITAVVNRDRKGVFETDLLRPLIAHWEDLTGRAYQADERIDVSLRVLADHSRGASMLLADGVVPSNEGRGYVLRRLIRRAMVHARRIGAREGLSSSVPAVAEIFGGVYPELANNVQRISEALRAEEDRFAIALRQGMERLEGLIDRNALNAEEVFYLHDTLGFPTELSAELAQERSITIDMTAVASLMEGQRVKSRASATGFSGPVSGTTTRFVGYDQLESGSRVLEVYDVPEAAGHQDIFVDVTPFYAEKGGQTFDTGWLVWDNGRGDVVDVQYQADAIRHRVRVGRTKLTSGTLVQAMVDPHRRGAVARHHSATHLLHRALRDVLGETASQAGSAVLPDHATFDFRFGRALTADELEGVSRRLNEKVRANLVRRVEELPLDKAIETGAVALFDEKYGTVVRVVSFGDWARELCGGTHVERSGEIGLVLVGTDKSVAAGVRRIELQAGAAAESTVRSHERALTQLGDVLRAGPSELAARVESLQAEVKRLQKELLQLRQRVAAGGSASVEEADVNGVKLVLQRVDAAPQELLTFADHALSRANGNSVAIVVGGRSLAIKVAAPLVGKLPAGPLVQAFHAVAGGKGGGRGQVGQGGGIDPARVDEGFKGVQEYVRSQMKPR